MRNLLYKMGQDFLDIEYNKKIDNTQLIKRMRRATQKSDITDTP